MLMNTALKAVANATSKIQSHITDMRRQFDNDFSVLENPLKSSIHAVGYVRYCDINTFGDHQTRAKDLDVGHVSKLMEQIIARGLSKVPYVEWNPEDENYVMLSGHHRIQAYHNMNVDQKGADETTSLIPVCVVEFYDKFDRGQFLQRENTLHKAQKNHSYIDAIKYLHWLRSENYDSWDNMIKTGEWDIVRASAYKAITDAGYPFRGPAKKNLFDEAFESELKLDTLRTITPKESNNKALHLWQLDRTDQWIDNKYVIASNTDGSVKSLRIATRKRLMYVDKNRLFGRIPLGCIKMYIHVINSKSFESLQSMRLRFMETLVLENCFDYCNPSLNCVVDEVVFAPQYKSGDGKIKETKEIRFIWDNQNKSFVLASDQSKDYSSILKTKTKKKKKNDERRSVFEIFDIKLPIEYKSNKCYEKQLQVYNMIADEVGFAIREFPTKNVFFNLAEAKAIALKIDPNFDFTNKTLCGDKKSIFSNVVKGWKPQMTTATHPSLYNMEKIYFSL